MKRQTLISQWIFLLIFGLAGCNRPPASAFERKVTVTLPTETAIPVRQPLTTPSSGLSHQNLLDLPYTEENPLSDPEEILVILDALAQRHIEWLSRPGWYVHRQYFTNVDDPHSRVWGTHFVNDLGDCAEQFEFKEEDGGLVPSKIVLPDGTEGYPYYVGGELDQAVFFLPEEGGACQIESDGYVWLVIQAVSDMERRLESAKAGVFEDYQLLLWQEVIDDREVIVLYEDFQEAPPKGTFRLANGTFVLVDRKINWTYRDPQTGGILGNDAVMYGEDGAILDGQEKGTREIVLSDLLFYDELPPDLAQAYQEAAEALQRYRDQGER